LLNTARKSMKAEVLSITVHPDEYCCKVLKRSLS